MIVEHRDVLNTLNWVALGALVVITMYALFGDDTKEALRFLETFRSGAVIIIPLIVVIAVASLYAETHRAVTHGKLGLGVLAKPALYVLIIALFMIFPLVSA